MIAFPNCKINLGLNITSKRTDGYHNLETVFFPIGLKDALEFVRSAVFKFTASGLPVNGDTDNNICIKAYQLIKKDFPQVPGINIHLHKAIPMGAGLGGGSSDGAYMLQLLNHQFHLQLSTQALLDYALQLGSDCPFFIVNQPCFATGRGEIMEPVALDLSGYQIVLVNPGIHVSTADAFASLVPQQPVKTIRQIIEQPINTWKNELVNDFEIPVFKQHPVIGKVKQQLYEAGALYASMSGSGSTVYGIFAKGDLQLPAFNTGFSVFIV